MEHLANIMPKSQLSDTPTDVLAEQARIFRSLPPDRRWKAVGAMYRSGRQMADIGYRMREPNANSRELLHNWLRLTLPDALYRYAKETAVESPEMALNEVRILAAELADLGIECVVGGSVASSFYGPPRFTNDADISVQEFRGREEALAEKLQANYYVSLPAVRQANEKLGSFNVLRNASGFKIDIFVQGRRPFELAAMGRRRIIPSDEAEEPTIYIHSPEDVLLHKLRWYELGNRISDRQWNDIVGLLRNQMPYLDQSYLATWSAELKIADLLQRAMQEVSEPDKSI